MKKQLLIMLLYLLMVQAGVKAQLQKQVRQQQTEPLTTELQANFSETTRYVFVQNQLLITNLKEIDVDGVAVINLQGVILQKQNVSGPALRLNLSDLEEGVHLLLLHSSIRMKEKMIKMVVKR